MQVEFGSNGMFYVQYLNYVINYSDQLGISFNFNCSILERIAMHKMHFMQRPSKPRSHH